LCKNEIFAFIHAEISPCDSGFIKNGFQTRSTSEISHGGSGFIKNGFQTRSTSEISHGGSGFNKMTHSGGLAIEIL